MTRSYGVVGLFTYEDWCPHEHRGETKRTPCEDRGTESRQPVTTQAEIAAAEPELHVEGGGVCNLYCT